MTTGRINQVTTLADRRDQLPRRSPVRQPTARGARTARASSLSLYRTVCHEPISVAVPSPHRAAAHDSDDGRASRTRLTVSSSRLPNTPCEAGILKTVEFVSNVYQTETIVPDCFRKPTIVHAGHALAVRLSAGHLQPRRCEKIEGVDTPTTTTQLRKPSSADAPSHVYAADDCKWFRKRFAQQNVAHSGVLRAAADPAGPAHSCGNRTTVAPSANPHG